MSLYRLCLCFKFIAIVTQLFLHCNPHNHRMLEICFNRWTKSANPLAHYDNTVSCYGIGCQSRLVMPIDPSSVCFVDFEWLIYYQLISG